MRIGISPLWAFFGGLLFTVHPVQSEAVALASNREELLCGLFFFLSYFLFLGKGRISLALSIVCMLIAVFSKEMAASLPLVLIAHEAYYSSHGESLLSSILKGVKKSLPFIVIAALPLVLKYAVLANPEGAAEFPGNTAWESIVIMSDVFMKYCRLVLMPLEQCADYVTNTGHTVAAPAGLIFFIVLAIYLRKFGKTGGFTLTFFFISLLPVSNIIPFGETMAERYLYIPLFSLSLGFSSILDRWKATRLKLIPATAILVFFSFLTVARLDVWKSDIDLWKDTTKCAPNSAEAWLNLGNSYLRRNDPVKALEMYSNVPKCRNEYENAKFHYNVGLAMERIGETEKAFEAFLLSIDAEPRFLESYYHAGSILGASGETDRGMSYLETAIKTDDEAAVSYYIAATYSMKYFDSDEKNDKSVEWLEAAVINDPMSGLYLGALGQAYLRTGRLEQAEKALLESLRLDKNLVPSYKLLILMYNSTGQVEKASEIISALKNIEGTN